MSEKILLVVIAIICATIFQLRSCQKSIEPQRYNHLYQETKEHRGTPRYNPNYGYEPYWLDGSWVYKRPKIPKNTLTTSMPQICGEECNYLYREIKNVCARLTSYRGFKGCRPSRCSWRWWGCPDCSGKIIDDLTEGFKTFPTYCEFLDKQCRSKFPDKWILVHMGECIAPQDLLFKPISVAAQMVSRQKYYLTRQSDIFVNYTTLAPFIFGG